MIPAATPLPAHDERGQVGGIEGLVFGVLVFVFGTLIVVNAWGVIDAKLATTSAAREAARTYVEAPSEAAAGPAALDSARQAIIAHGRRWERTRVTSPDAGFHRCERVTIEVAYEVPLIAIPIIGQAGKGITVTSRHSEIVDPYRGGLGGAAACP